MPRSQATAALADANAARAQATAAQERAMMAQNTPPPALGRKAGRSNLPSTLPNTGSTLPLIGLCGLFSLSAAGVLRFLRR